MLLLRQLSINEVAIVKRVTASGELGRRIRDFGIIPGVSIKVVGEAPLHDPVAIKVHGSVLTLRNSEADYIEVERVDEKN